MRQIWTVRARRKCWNDGIQRWFAHLERGKVCDFAFLLLGGSFTSLFMTIALAIPPLTVKNRGGGALIQDRALNRANTVRISLPSHRRYIHRCVNSAVANANDDHSFVHQVVCYTVFVIDSMDFRTYNILMTLSATFRRSRVWHLVFRLGARKGLLIKISGQKQDFWLSYIQFWAPSLKNLGAHSKIYGHMPLGKSNHEKIPVNNRCRI